MKHLQKYFCTIFLFLSIIIAGCKTNVGTSGNDTETIITARFTVTDGDGNPCELIQNDTVHSTTVKTDKARLTVNAQPFGAEVSIDGAKTRTKDFTFAANEDSKTSTIVIAYNGKTQTHTVKIRYNAGAIKKVIVTDDANKSVPVTFSATSGYLANVGTTKAKVEVETSESAGSVTIDGVKTNKKEVNFGSGEKVKKLTVAVIHNGVEEKTTVTITYSDPSLTPQVPVLKGLTVTNADDESQSFALSPLFQAYNSAYTIGVPASVSKIKIVPTVDTGITATVDGGEVQALQEGSNIIKIKTKQTESPTNAYEYTITVNKAGTGASSNAALKTLVLESGLSGVSKPWIEAPATFAKATYTYTCKMNASCDQFYIQATPDDANAVMTVTANDSAPLILKSGENTKFTPLKGGENLFVITVTAADAVSTKQYTIKAIRPEGSFVLKTFTGTGLSDFYTAPFNEYKKSGVFGTKNFDATVSKSLASTTITAVPEFPLTTKMKIRINKDTEKVFNGSATVDLTKDMPRSPGYVRVQIILLSDVLVVDEYSPNVYTLWIKKVDTNAEAKNSLTDLKVQYYGNGYKFYAIPLNEAFSPAKTDYTLTLSHGITEIRVTATPESKKASIDGWQGEYTNAFYPPFDKVTIPVVAQNGDRKEYTITIKTTPVTTITIDNIVKDQIIDLSALPSEGLTVTGSFTNPSDVVSEIWVGSSGLPIQQEKGGKWVKAVITGSTTFKAVLPKAALSDLPNGLRDIKAGAFTIQGTAAALTRVPVTITGNSTPTATVIATIKSSFTIPANASMSIVALDQALYGKGEDVVFASNELPVRGMSFPTNIPLCGIPVGHECRVEVYIHEKILGRDVLLYYGVEKLLVQAGVQNSCELTLKQAQ